MCAQIYFQSPTHSLLDLDFLLSYTKRLLSSFDKLWYFASFKFCIMFNKTKKIKSPSGLLRQKWGKIVFSNNSCTTTLSFYIMKLIIFHKEFGYEFPSLEGRLCFSLPQLPWSIK